MPYSLQPSPYNPQPSPLNRYSPSHHCVTKVTRETAIVVAPSPLATPDEMRGRVGAVNFLFINASNQLGQFESGVTAALLGGASPLLRPEIAAPEPTGPIDAAALVAAEAAAEFRAHLAALRRVSEPLGIAWLALGLQPLGQVAIARTGGAVAAVATLGFPSNSRIAVSVSPELDVDAYMRRRRHLDEGGIPSRVAPHDDVGRERDVLFEE